MSTAAADTRAPLAGEGPIPVRDAPAVFDQSMPTEPAAQAAFFREQGFFIVRDLLGPAEVEELRREIDRIARDYARLPRIREGFDLEPRQDAGRQTPTFRKIGGITELSLAFNRLMRHARVTGLLHLFTGADRIDLYRDVVMMKPARVGREKPWHQDSVYWPYRPMQLLSAMTALDDAGPDNGCMQVIPGSHVQEIQHYGQELRIDLNDQQQARAMYVPLKAGDTLLFHSLLLHASQPNTSGRDRRVCIISYKPSGLAYIGKGEEPAAIVASET